MDGVKQFLEITQSNNEQIAAYYLELSAGDVQKAIGIFFEDNSSGDTIDDQDSKFTQISVLEWNIQGLLEDFLNVRTQAIVGIIKLHRPTVVMLQEVVLETYHYLKSVLMPNYKSFSPTDLSGMCGHYFTAIFVNTEILTPTKARVVPFPSSMQARQILVVEAKCKDRDVVFLTSHLESTREGAAERKRQLMTLFNSMKHIGPDRTVIFGGDTNLRDAEYNSVVSKSEFDVNLVNDVWVMLGSPQNCRYSWDLTENDNQIKDGKARLRFERLYARVEKESNRRVYKPRNMKFVGTDRLDCGKFPSDHWGILAHFGVD